MHSKKTVIVGSVIIALAVIIILAATLMPRILTKDDMRDLLCEAASPEAQFVYVSDPRHENEGLLAVQGKEAKLTGDTLTAVQKGLVELSKNFSFKKSNQDLAGFDLHLMVKTTAGETIKIYFTDTYFYWCEHSVYHYFAPKDEAAYAAFLQQLRTALQS